MNYSYRDRHNTADHEEPADKFLFLETCFA